MRDRQPLSNRFFKPRAFEALETRRVLSAVSFLPNPVATLASRPRQLVSGDINTDGRIDLVAFDNDKLSWIENQGANNQFETRVIADIELQSIQLADLDSDGDLDIIGAREQDFGTQVEDRIFWLENTDGKGNFSQHHTIANSEWFWIGQLVAIDLDEDQDMDLVIGTGGGLGGGSVLWFENDGNENFADAQRIGGSETAIFVTVEDVDRDGDLDVMAAFGSDFPYLLLVTYQNDGRERFTSREIQEFDPQPDNQSFPTGVALADVDGDGDKDWITGLSSFVIDEDGIPKDVNSVGWNENTSGRGEFATREVIWQSDAVGWVQLLDVVDLDGDGDNDMLGTISGDLHLFDNLGNGQFAPPQPLGESTASQLTVTDFDRDGDLDLVGLTASGVTWLEQRRLGDFTNDGRVDFADFLILSSRFGSTDATWEDGDLDGDEIVTFRDFLVFADQFGR